MRSGPFRSQIRATGVEARLDKENITGGEPPDCNPPGWNPNAYTRGSRIIVARTHLLAHKLGGLGTCDNLVTACHAVNQDMFNRAEFLVLQRVKFGFEVDYEVEAIYDTLDDAIPSEIRVTAISENADGTCWLLGPIPFTNPTNLQRCL